MTVGNSALSDPKSQVSGRSDLWVERVRQGDEEAASELYDRLHPLVLRIVRAHLPRRASEDDLVQAVFMKIFSKLAQFSGRVPLEHWVSRIAVNTCINELQRERVRPELRWADLTEPEESALQTLADAREETSLPQQYAARELLSKLMEQLKPAERLVITLLHLQGQSVAEVGEITGWSAPLVKIRAFRARQRMKKGLKQLLREGIT